MLRQWTNWNLNHNPVNDGGDSGGDADNRCGEANGIAGEIIGLQHLDRHSSHVNWKQKT